jgi:hypothetical protein
MTISRRRGGGNFGWMPKDRQDEIMEEVVKLQRLIADCCPEVFSLHEDIVPDSIDPMAEIDVLNRHRLSIMMEATGKKESHL